MHKQILNLRNQLLNLGYHQFQIENILKDIVGKKSIDSLSQAEVEQVATELSEYIAFAGKCRQKRL